MARWGKKKYGDFKYYNVWHADPDKNNYPDISARRQLIGLSNLGEKDRNGKINAERRKSRTCNSTILLE